jgi:hypothetical protein
MPGDLSALGAGALASRASPKSELRKLARQLCYRDGMAWSLSDFEKGVFGVLTVVADERKRREYLNRARETRPSWRSVDRGGASSPRCGKDQPEGWH